MTLSHFFPTKYCCLSSSEHKPSCGDLGHLWYGTTLQPWGSSVGTCPFFNMAAVKLWFLFFCLCLSYAADMPMPSLALPWFSYSFWPRPAPSLQTCQTVWTVGRTWWTLLDLPSVPCLAPAGLHLSCWGHSPASFDVTYHSRLNFPLRNSLPLLLLEIVFLFIEGCI